MSTEIMFRSRTIARTVLLGALAGCGAASQSPGTTPRTIEPSIGSGASSARSSQVALTPSNTAACASAVAEPTEAPPAKDIAALLAPFEGNWDTRITWSAPDFPKPLEWTGKSQLHVLGGRWLVTHHEGAFMGMGFEAQDVTGFDTRTQKWTSVWADKVNDSMMFFEGPSAQKGPEQLIAATLDDKGGKSWLRRATTWRDDNTFVMSFSAPDPKGQERPVMTITSTRASTPPAAP